MCNNLEVLAEQVRKMNEIFRSPGRAKIQKAELQIIGSQGRADVRKRNFKSLEVPAEMKSGNGLILFGRLGRTSAEDKRDLPKSWPSGSMESGTSDLWQ